MYINIIISLVTQANHHDQPGTNEHSTVPRKSEVPDMVGRRERLENTLDNNPAKTRQVTVPLQGDRSLLIR